MERTLGEGYPNVYRGERRTIITVPNDVPVVEERTERRSSGSSFSTIAIIILVIIIVILLILVIVFALRKPTTPTPYGGKCRVTTDCPLDKICFGGTCVACASDSDCTNGTFCINTVCAACSNPPTTPNNTNVIYNSTTGIATISWNSVSNAASYNVYRKVNDPSVGVSNYEEKRTTTSAISSATTSMNFSGLTPNTTSYFVVTSVNLCGESPASTVVFSPTCSVLLAQPPPPTIIPLSNNCLTVQNSQIISATFPDASLPNGAYVIRGNNQTGTVSDYLYIVMQSSYGTATGITQRCNGQTSNHTLLQIRNTQSANITTVTSPPNASVVKTLEWNTVAGAESYIYWVVGQEAVTNNLHFYGGFAPANATSVTFAVTPNDTFVYMLVLGYKFCDISSASNPTLYTSPT